jgi:hypothetical protein
LAGSQEVVERPDESSHLLWERLGAPGPEMQPWDFSENDDFFSPLRATSQSAHERVVQAEQSLEKDKRDYLEKEKAFEKAFRNEQLGRLSTSRQQRRTRQLFSVLRKGCHADTIATTQWRHGGGAWTGHGDLSDLKCVRLWEEDDEEKEQQKASREMNRRTLQIERNSLFDSLDRDRRGSHRREECEWLANHAAARLCPEEAGVTGPGLISRGDMGWPDPNEAEEFDRLSRSGSIFSGRGSAWSKEFSPSPAKAGSYSYQASLRHSPSLSPSPGRLPIADGGGVCQACGVS